MQDYAKVLTEREKYLILKVKEKLPNLKYEILNKETLLFTGYKTDYKSDRQIINVISFYDAINLIESCVT